MQLDITPIKVFEELRFIGCLILAECVFLFPCCKKRSHFLWRFIPTTIGLLILSLGYFFFLNAVETALISSDAYKYLIVAWYCFLTLLTCFYQWFCFDFGFDQAILHTISGYAISHIEYALINEMFSLTLFPEIRNVLPAYIAICLVTYAGILVVTYFTLVHQFSMLNNIYMPKKKTSIFIYTVVLVITVFLTFGGQTVYRNGSTTEKIPDPNYLGLAIELLTCMLVLFIQYLLYSSNKEKHEKDIVDQLLYENKRQYELKKESINIINHKCHDMKHQIAALQTMNMEDKEQMISQLEKDIMIYDNSIKTNNEALNILLMEKQLYCINKKIRLSFLGDCSKLTLMSTSDLYTLFGNALDNAIEAVEQLDENMRVIDVSANYHLDSIFINISNYCRNGIEMVDGAPSTSKADKDYHGFGISSMKEIVHKYHGVFDIEIKDNIFTLRISIPA